MGECTRRDDIVNVNVSLYLCTNGQSEQIQEGAKGCILVTIRINQKKSRCIREMHSAQRLYVDALSFTSKLIDYDRQSSFADFLSKILSLRVHLHKKQK